MTNDTVFFKMAHDLRRELYGSRPIIGARKVGNLLFVSGSGSSTFAQGHIGANLGVKEGYAACQNITLRILKVVYDSIGNLDNIDQIVSAFALVNADDSFTDLHAVFAGCSDTLYTIFGDKGICPRTVMGTRNMPSGNTAAEIELLFLLKE